MPDFQPDNIINLSDYKATHFPQEGFSSPAHKDETRQTLRKIASLVGLSSAFAKWEARDAAKHGTRKKWG